MLLLLLATAGILEFLEIFGGDGENGGFFHIREVVIIVILSIQGIVIHVEWWRSWQQRCIIAGRGSALHLVLPMDGHYGDFLGLGPGFLG